MDLQELDGILDRLLTTAPKHPGHAYWLFPKSVAHSCEGPCERALGYAEQSTEEQPAFALSWMHLANLLGRLTRHEAARAAAQRCNEINAHMSPDYYASLMSVLSDNDGVIASRTTGLRQAGLISETRV